MSSIVPPVSPLLRRVVYRAPQLTEDGDAVHFAVDHEHRVIPSGEMMLPPADDATESVSELWRRLDKADPEHSRRRKS